MSKQVSGSDKEELGKRNTAPHAGFLRPGPPLQYQVIDRVHQATSDTPHHPSRPPNFALPWRFERPLSTHHTISERTLYSSVLPEATRISSMGNKNDSDKIPASLGPVSGSSSKGDIVRTAAESPERSSQPVAARGGSQESRTGINPISQSTPSHSGDWLKHSRSQSHTEAPGTSQQVVPLITPSALADMGHLYKLPPAPSPSRPQIYQPGMFAPLYTSAVVTPQQFPAYASPSAVQVSTLPTYSPYLSGYPLSYPVVAAQGTVRPGPFPTVESYSAMLASMGNQVQQAQGTRLPATTYLPPGVIPLPYGTQLTPGVPGLGVLPKGAVQESLPTVAYINQQLAAPGILQSGHHVLTSLVPVTGSILSFPPRSEEEAGRIELSQEKGDEQEPISCIQLIKGEERSTQRCSEVSPRQTFGTQPHVMFDKPDDPCPENLQSASVHRQSVQDNKSHIIPNMHQESAIPHSSDKSRPAGQEEHSGEHSHWVGSGEGTGAYPVPVPPAAQHSPHVKFHLSPSPQARPSPTIIQPPSAETEGGTAKAATTSLPSQMTYLISAAERVEQTRSQSQEMMAHSSMLEPHHSHVQHLLAAPQIPAPPAFSNIPSYFTRGSVIQLASGELKRVEDIRTEDFVQSAEMCEGLKIDSSTVVRINEHADNCVALISFLVGEHKAQVSLEAPMEHPFFVFGQGWSAVQPERSIKSYNLGCHKLAVGDVCVSLTVKDKNGQWLYPPQPTEQPLSQQQQLHHQMQSHQAPVYQQLPVLPPPQQQQQQEIPMQSVFSGAPKELLSWSPEPKRQRLLEPVQEDTGWEDKSDPRPHASWQREAQQHEARQHGSNLESAAHHTFAVPTPGSTSVSVEQPAGKLTAQMDSNANMVLVRTSNTTVAQEKSLKLSPRTDGKPLQPLKRRWSDPMHQAQLAAEQEKYGLSTKSTESQ